MSSNSDTIRSLYAAFARGDRAPYVHVWKLKGGQVRAFEQHTDTAVVQRALEPCRS